MEVGRIVKIILKFCGAIVYMIKKKSPDGRISSGENL